MLVFISNPYLIYFFYTQNSVSHLLQSNFNSIDHRGFFSICINSPNAHNIFAKSQNYSCLSPQRRAVNQALNLKSTHRF